MMHRILLSATLLSIILPAVPGCSKGEDKHLTSIQQYYAKMDETKANRHEHLKYMTDNAMLHDMSVAEIHFVPHTAELSGTGAARLDRLAPLLDTYGGTVRYETFSPDDALVAQRIENVREYLTLTGCNMDRVQVKPMLSGGRYTPAAEAIVVMEKGTEKPADLETGGSFVTGGGGR